MGRGACYQWRSSGRSQYEALRERSWSITLWRSSKQTRDRIQYLWCFVWILWLFLLYLTTSPQIHHLNNCFKMFHLPCIYLIQIIQITNKGISVFVMCFIQEIPTKMFRPAFRPSSGWSSFTRMQKYKSLDTEQIILIFTFMVPCIIIHKIE
jgi:hypothetical protein